MALCGRCDDLAVSSAADDTWLALTADDLATVPPCDNGPEDNVQHSETEH